MNFTHRMATVGCACLIAASASAEPLSFSGLNEEEWRHEITLYGFLPAQTSGTSTIAGSSVPLDLKFSDAVELLEFAISGRYEAWKGDWGVILDVNHIDLGAGGSAPGPAGVELDADIRQSWVSLLAAYRVANTTYGSDGRRMAVDIQGGVRYNKIKQEISADPSPPPFPLGGTEDWWEPVIGARGMWEIHDDWAVILQGDLGGFGVGGNNLQYGANLLFDWKPWQNTSIKFGYRFYGIDFETDRSDGDFAYQVDQHGPVIGVTFRWQ